MKIKLSIIIPTFNREQVLCDTINSVLYEIKQCSYSDECELIIIDQTKEHTLSIAEYIKDISLKSFVKYVYESYANLPHARNVGLKYAKGDIICFLDDDIKLHDGFLDRLMDRYEDKQIMSVVGLPILVNQDGENILLDSQGIVKKLLRIFLANIFCRNKASVITSIGLLLNNREHSRAKIAEDGRGCCMSFRKCVFDMIGLFDINYVGNALREETDIFFRMKKYRLCVFFDPDLVLDHIMANDGGCRNQKKEKYWQLYFDNQFYFFLKNYAFPKWYIKLLLLFDIITLKRNGLNVNIIINNSFERAKSLLNIDNNNYK